MAEHTVHQYGLLKPGQSIPQRITQSPQVPEVEIKPPPHFIEWSQARLLRHLDRIVEFINDETRLVEEYSTESSESATGETSIQVQADYSPASELITEVLVTGPPSTSFVLQLGSRYITGVTNVTGVFILSPVRFILPPDAQRILTVGSYVGTDFTNIGGVTNLAADTAGSAKITNTNGVQAYLTGFDINAGVATSAGALAITVSGIGAAGPLSYTLEESTTQPTLLSIRYPGIGLPSTGQPTVAVAALSGSGTTQIAIFGSLQAINANASWMLHLSGHALVGRKT